jgi:cell pole-organizing protein PopZ
MMGDISTEPSMEEILSSIKRIIAEEGDAATGSRARRPAAPKAAPVAHADDAEEVLELSEPVPDPVPAPGVKPLAIGAPDVPSRAPAPAARAAEPAKAADPIISDSAAEATRGPLEALSRMVVKPEVAGSDTLEGMVREMIKPMLRDWLDANLPQIVEGMVAREISRITGR